MFHLTLTLWFITISYYNNPRDAANKEEFCNLTILWDEQRWGQINKVIKSRALICYLHNPKIFFAEIPQGPLGISIGNIRIVQRAFRVPQSSVFCHFQCFIEISPKIWISSQSHIFWPIFKCHTILESYWQHGRRGLLQVKIKASTNEIWAFQKWKFWHRNFLAPSDLKIFFSK